MRACVLALLATLPLRDFQIGSEADASRLLFMTWAEKYHVELCICWGLAAVAQATSRFVLGVSSK